MAVVAERTTQRGMSFPFVLALVYIIAVLADYWLGENAFITSSAYRDQSVIALGLMAFGFLLWLWVLAAARRRNHRFDGPIQTARGTNGGLQPVLATVFIVIATNLAYSHVLPKWLNAISEGPRSAATFVIDGDVAPLSDGCHPTQATAEGYGTVSLCLPARLVSDNGLAPGTAVTLSGPASCFGMEVTRYAAAAPVAATVSTEPVPAAEAAPPASPARKPSSGKLESGG